MKRKRRIRDHTQQRRTNTYVELQGRDSLAVLGSNSGGSDDLDGLVARAVATSHVVI